MQALHQQQPPLAHRDVKPHNVLIRRAEPDSEAASPSASSAASSGRRAESQLKSNGESEPLASSHTGHARSYHAVLMVGAPTQVLWTSVAANSRLPGVDGTMQVTSRLDLCPLKEPTYVNCSLQLSGHQIQ